MFGFWHRWIMIGYIGFIIFGLLFAILGATAFFAPVMRPILASFWVDGVIPAEAQNFAAFSFGIAGALTLALGELGWFVAKYALPRGERWAWTALVASLTAWFILDSAMSIYSGASINAVFNLGFYIILMVPLIAIRPHMGLNHQSEPAVAGA